MDNAVFHKSQKTKDLIESVGAKLLFLPPYSPDLNPIEKKFGSLKRFRQYNAHLSLDDLIKIYR
jgi:putative transposase